MKLVDHVFSEQLGREQLKTKKDLLDMMEHFGLIAPFKVSDAGEVRYFVPAQLQSNKKFLDIQPLPTGPCALYVNFDDGFVPHGLYSLLVSRFIKWCSEEGSPKEPNLYLNAARYFIGTTSDYQLVLRCHKHFIKVVLTCRPMEEPCFYEPAVSIRKFIESSLEQIPRECRCYRSLRYHLAVLCSLCQSSCENHKKVACRNDACIHLLRVEGPNREKLLCKRKNDWPKVKNLEVWYSTKRK